MNKDQLQGNWTQLKGKLREQWGRLTDDDIELYRGKREQFLGKIQESYGYARNEAEQRLAEFEKSSGIDSNSSRAA